MLLRHCACYKLTYCYYYYSLLFLADAWWHAFMLSAAAVCFVWSVWVQFDGDPEWATAGRTDGCREKNFRPDWSECCNQEQSAGKGRKNSQNDPHNSSVETIDHHKLTFAMCFADTFHNALLSTCTADITEKIEKHRASELLLLLDFYLLTQEN